MDLEMTGLDSVKDRILEVAVIATDWSLNELATYEGIVKVNPNLLEKRFKLSLFWSGRAKQSKQMIEQNNQATKNTKQIEAELLAFVDANFKLKEPIYLAGNSIHCDRQFIKHEWPKLDRKLHYRMLDVSAWKIIFENKIHAKFVKPDVHRALSDIEGSIDELKFYLQKIKF